MSEESKKCVVCGEEADDECPECDAPLCSDCTDIDPLCDDCIFNGA